MKALVTTLAALIVTGCAQQSPAPPAAERSGFLDDYTLLRAGGANDVRLVYRDPQANWPAYHTVLLEPVTLWRSGRKSLDPVPEEDLLRLVSDFQDAVRQRLGDGFRFTEQLGPGVIRIRLGITDAKASDRVLDVLTAPETSRPDPGGAGPLNPETKRMTWLGVAEARLLPHISYDRSLERIDDAVEKILEDFPRR